MVQEALLVADWPERLLTVDKCAERTSSDGRIIFRGPCVRMGVHVGKPECKVNPITGACYVAQWHTDYLLQGGQIIMVLQSIRVPGFWVRRSADRFLAASWY